MNTRRVNGQLFEKMLRNGLVNLKRHRDEINALNVFPVADGDTGTNMCLTVEKGLQFAQSSAELYPYLKLLSEGMLFGARGNSGVILSQLFTGFYQELSRCSAANVADLRNAFIRAYRVAYRAVACPVEGTILTVAREGIERSRSQIDRRTSVETLLSIYVAEMKKSLAETPELLPVLKESNVVDSGGAGYICIIEGMLKYLYGDVLSDDERPVPVTESVQAPDGTVSLELFNENTAFEHGYCLEFLLQLMKGKQYTQRFRLDAFIEDLQLYGNSIVATQADRRVKVHIHTFKPAKVIRAAQEYGEFLTFKLENMHIQHAERERKLAEKKPHRPLSVVAVANGDGMIRTFEELGCDVVLDGGPTMNTSSEEFVKAFANIDADAIVVLPNNKNIVRAAEQAVQLSGRTDVTVLPTASMTEGYCALTMDIRDSQDVDLRIRQMREGAGSNESIAVAVATRNITRDGVSCTAGQSIVLEGDALKAAADDPFEALSTALNGVEGLDERECCVVFLGEDAPNADEERLTALLEDVNPMIEVTCIRGDQHIYRWLLGIF
ncbi:MAG: DAK2 domain-containing protein [Clostridia bacterium]|nr:DAK2 domain-containing protein [Clostridia bacterium]